MSKVNEVNASNCVNATDVGFSQVFTTRSLTSGAGKRVGDGAVWVAVGLTMAALMLSLLLD